MAESKDTFADAPAPHTLSPEELIWCRELKAALRRPDDKPLPNIPQKDDLTAAERAKVAKFSDFRIAQFAIIAKGNIPKALFRVKNYIKHLIDVYHAPACDAEVQKLAQDMELVNFFNRKWPGMITSGRKIAGGNVGH